MDNEEIEKDLNELLKNGVIKHAGFKEGDDTFNLTDKGILGIESELAENPEMVLFLLSMAETDEIFYKIIENVANLKKSIEGKKIIKVKKETRNVLMHTKLRHAGNFLLLLEYIEMLLDFSQFFWFKNNLKWACRYIQLLR